MKKKEVLLGVCPIGKFVFSHEDAMRQKKKILETLDSLKINYCTIDDVIPDGMVRDQKHVEPVVEHFKKNKVDALFVPHCNFGTEGAVGMIGKKLGLPVLLWGPRDEAPLEDGSRYRDSLCGMFASSKVLGKLGVPFTYIENCDVADPLFREGVKNFISTASVVKTMRNMRIGQIGVRVDFFWTTIGNESEILEKFDIEVIPFDMSDFVRSVKDRMEKNKEQYKKEASGYEDLFKDTSLLTSDGTLNGLAMRDELLEIAETENIDAFSIKTFTSIGAELGPGLPLGAMLLRDKIVIASESDLYGAVSSLLINSAKRTEDVVFFPEFTIRHPENDNAILLWHGVPPLSLKHPDIKELETYPPWILKNLKGASPKMRLKDGPLTVCRFDGETGSYVLGIGEGKTVPGPDTREFHVWMEVDNWPRWERRIIEGPYIHHCSAVYDHCGDALEEACKYIPGLKAQRFDRS